MVSGHLRFKVLHFFQPDYPYRDAGGGGQPRDSCPLFEEKRSSLLAIRSLDLVRGAGHGGLLFAFFQVCTQRGCRQGLHGDLSSECCKYSVGAAAALCHFVALLLMEGEEHVAGYHGAGEKW